MVVSMEGEMDELHLKIHNGRLAMLEMTGGRRVQIPEQELPLPAPIVVDSLLAAYESGPEAMLAAQERLESQHHIGLARSQHLPKISGGYFSEAIPSEAFRGFTVGISLPLWENARKLKSAQSAYLQSQAREEAFLIKQDRLLRQKLEERSMLNTRMKRLQGALGEVSGQDQLASALEAGEISLTEYFYSSDFYFRNRMQLLDYKRDLLVLEADLLKIYF
jgi:outer membrane protein TolC